VWLWKAPEISRVSIWLKWHKLSRPLEMNTDSEFTILLQRGRTQEVPDRLVCLKGKNVPDPWPRRLRLTEEACKCAILLLEA